MSVRNDQVDRRQEVKIIEQPGVERREEIHEDIGVEQQQNLYRVSEFIWLVTGVLEGLVGIRVILRLLGANPGNAFAQFIYSLTAIFVRPFSGLLATPAANGYVLEIYSLIAMLVYGLMAWAVVRLVWIVFYHPTARTVTRYERNRT